MVPEELAARRVSPRHEQAVGMVLGMIREHFKLSGDPNDEVALARRIVESVQSYDAPPAR